MTKQEFLARLGKELSGLPKAEAEERLAFYGEAIDDRMEEGFSEEDAVADVGTVEELVSQTVAEIPLGKLVKERVLRKKKWKTWETVLLAVGFPLWFPLLISGLVTVFALYPVYWTVVIVAWSFFVAFAVCVPACAVVGAVILVKSNAFAGIALWGAGVFSAGLAVFAFYACKALTKGALSIAKRIAVRIKKMFIKKENNDENE